MKTTLTQLFTIFVFLIAVFQLEAATYYFSTSIGDDSRSANQAQNPNTPWKSIEKLNSIMRTLNPGDQILFRRGETFYGTINLTKSGSAGNPIKFGAYGSGDKPVITTFVEMDGWGSVGNGIFESSNSRLSSSKVNVVLLNDEIEEMGRYPNSDANNKGYLTYQGASSRSITSPQLSGSPNWAGAEVVIRKLFWITDRHRISSHSGNTINFQHNPDTGYDPRAGYGFFIQDHIRTLDKLGEWYYNPQTRRFNMFFGNQSPNNQKVKVATRDYIVRGSMTLNNLLFENISFQGANKDVFRIGSSGRNIRINQCDIEFAGENAIWAEGIDGFVVENSNINFAHINGVNLNSSPNAIVRRNSIQNVYMFPGHGGSGDNKGVSIFATDHNSKIEQNEVINSGYIGIRFGGNNTAVKNNYIDNFCLTKNDGGGIYSYAHSHQRFTGRKIENNIIMNGKGVREGTNIRLHLSRPQAEGIYLDDNVTGVEVVGNTVAHVTSKGIYLHNTENIVVSDNTIFDANHLVFLRNDLMGNPLRNNTFRNNKLVIANGFQKHLEIHTIRNDVAQLANFSNNNYSAPFTDDVRFSVRYNVGSSNEVNQLFTLNGWRNAYGKDAGSSTVSELVNLDEVRERRGNNKFSNGSFNSNVNGANCQNCSATWDNSGRLDGGSLKVSVNRQSQLSMVIGQVREGRRYLVKFSAVGNRSIPINLYLRQNGSPWETISPDGNFEVTNRRQDYEIILKAVTSIDNARILFRGFDVANAEYWIDNLEVHEVETTEYDPMDFVTLELNKSSQSRSLNLGNGLSDIFNRIGSNNISIPSFSSFLVLRKDGPRESSDDNFKVEVVSSQNNFTTGGNLPLEVKTQLTGGQVQRVNYYANGNSIGQSTQAPFNFVWRNVPAGNHRITAVAHANNGMQASSEEFLAQVANAAPIEDSSSGSSSGFSLFLNTGSSQASVMQNVNFAGETGNNRFFSNSRTNSNRNASDIQVFTSERFSNKLTYRIPVPNGNYKVRTYHNELWYGRSGPAARNGRRVFDIEVEGRLVKKDFDIFRENQNKPTILSFENISVTDGVLEIVLSASIDNASISALSIEDMSSNPISFDSSLEGALESSAGGNSAMFLNAGSSDRVTYNNMNFNGDESTGFFGNSTANTNPSVTNEQLFQTERYARELNYEIPIPNGTYTVITYHNELWFGSFGPSAAEGRRVFDISLQGNVVKRNFDIFRENNNRPTSLEFEQIRVSDGRLRISLSASRDNATLSGIAIFGNSNDVRGNSASNNPIFINSGGDGHVNFKGFEFRSDNESDFHTPSNTNINRSVTNEPLFQTERFGSDFSYEIPVDNGVYQVVTFHNELWFGSFGPSAAAGRRVFDIQIEGNSVKSRLDFFLESSNNSFALTFNDIEVSDGRLDLRFIATQNNASVSGIAVIPQHGSNPSFREMYTEDLAQMFSDYRPDNGRNAPSVARVFPNPASWRAVVEMGRDVKVDQVAIHSTNGQLIKKVELKEEGFSGSQYVVPIEDLNDGMYLLTIYDGDRMVERLKLMVRQ